MNKNTLCVKLIDLNSIGEVLKQNIQLSRQEEYLETWINRIYPKCYRSPAHLGSDS
jgi:hypothetical protein